MDGRTLQFPFIPEHHVFVQDTALLAEFGLYDDIPKTLVSYMAPVDFPLRVAEAFDRAFLQACTDANWGRSLQMLGVSPSPSQWNDCREIIYELQQLRRPGSKFHWSQVQLLYRLCTNQVLRRGAISTIDFKIMKSKVKDTLQQQKKTGSAGKTKTKGNGRSRRNLPCHLWNDGGCSEPCSNPKGPFGHFCQIAKEGRPKHRANERGCSKRGGCQGAAAEPAE